MKLDHIGIIVPDLISGRDHFSTVYNISSWTKEFVDEINGVYIQFCRDVDGNCFELVAPIDNNSPIYNTINRGVNIINHFAYRVVNIDDKLQHLSDNGFIPLGCSKRAIAYKMKKIQFFYSKDFNYILELIESSDHNHEYV